MMCGMMTIKQILGIHMNMVLDHTSMYHHIITLHPCLIRIWLGAHSVKPEYTDERSMISKLWQCSTHEWYVAIPYSRPHGGYGVFARTYIKQYPKRNGSSICSLNGEYSDQANEVNASEWIVDVSLPTIHQASNYHYTCYNWQSTQRYISTIIA